MNEQDVARCWEGNVAAWTKLVRAGYDVYRDAFNTPAFLDFLPPVEGLQGLDVGCGEGHNTRLVAARGAQMRAVDIAPSFITHARAAEEDDPRGIEYTVASATDLPLAQESFDFATAFMSLMDMADLGRALSEIHRILRPGGFFQFSISHPCFDTPHRVNLRDDSGTTYAIEVGDYFRRMDGEILEWLCGAAPPEAKEGLPPFQVPRFTRPLSEWLNLLLDAGFVLERFSEPRPSDTVVRVYPGVQDAQVVAYFLHVRVRKP
jgi:SAM-dependent methyltransferase